MKYLQSISRLPKGVESMLERLKDKEKQTERKRLESGSEYLNYKISAKSVPNFKRLHKLFEEQLTEKKKFKKATQPEPFKFAQTRKTAQMDFLDVENE